MSAELDEVANRIVGWLKANGKYNEGPAWTFEEKKEPWQRFTAEVQHWKTHIRLIVGYTCEVNGDLVPDPLISLTIKYGVTEAIIQTQLGDFEAINDPYTREFLKEVERRHLVSKAHA